MISIPGRIPIRIHPFFWALALLLGWNFTQTAVGTVVCVVVILLSLLIHEFGHALTALVFRQQAVVYLLAFGGLTARRGPPLRRWQEFLIILNGPLAGLSACGIALLLRPLLPSLPPLSNLALSIFIGINFYWSLLNLLPMMPLDGGRLMAVLFEALFGVRGLQISLVLSLIFALVLSVLLFLMQELLGGALVLIFAFESVRDLVASRSLSSMDRDQGILQLYADAQKAMAQGSYEEAVSLLEELRAKSEKGLYFSKAGIDLASIYVSRGEVELAYRILHPLRKSLEGDPLLLLHQLAFSMGEWKEAIETGMESYRGFRSYETAFALALSHARLEDAASVMGWLNRAYHDGMPKIHESLDRAEFDFMRRNPEFQAFKRSVVH